MSTPNNDTYLPIYDTIPDDWKEAQGFFVEQLKKISEGINVREVGLYVAEQTLTGGQYIASSNDPTALRSDFRLTIDFGALPNTGTKSVAHGLTFNQYLTGTKYYATATDPVNFKMVPIPYASADLTKVIEMNMDATNVNITTSMDYSSYTRCFVVVNFLQEI